MANFRTEGKRKASSANEALKHFTEKDYKNCIIAARCNGKCDVDEQSNPYNIDVTIYAESFNEIIALIRNLASWAITIAPSYEDEFENNKYLQANIVHLIEWVNVYRKDNFA